MAAQAAIHASLRGPPVEVMRLASVAAIACTAMKLETDVDGRLRGHDEQ
jgi:hypothetical protein